MKTGRGVVVALLIAASTMGAFGDPGPIKVVSTKRDVFYFKVDEALVGASLEVYDERGNKMIEQRIEKKRVIVDFYYDQPGRYIIKVADEEDKIKEVFIFEKFGPSHAERFAGDFVLVTDF